MPKTVNHLQVAKNNLTIPNNITPEQYSIRVATAQAAATVALAEQQARTADALDLANMIQARHMGIYNTPAEYQATEARLRGLLGLEGPRHD